MRIHLLKIVLKSLKEKIVLNLKVGRLKDRKIKLLNQKNRQHVQSVILALIMLTLKTIQSQIE